jgi:hypothetical protein
MPRPDTAFTEAELADIETWVKEDLHRNLGQQATARRTLQLVAEVRWHREPFARLYHGIPDTLGDVQLQAELEREALRLGVIRTRDSDVH